MTNNETRVPRGSGLLSSPEELLSRRKSGSTEFLINLAIAVLSFSLQHTLTAQLTILHSFGDGTVPNDGAKPEAGLIQAPNGDFFGVTDTVAVKSTPVGGTVFWMAPSGKLVVIHRFGSTSWLWSTDPLLYYHKKLIGTTNQGPAAKPPGSQGIGSVYAMYRSSGSWRRDFWCTFVGANNGHYPSGGVILGSDGFLYGTTSAGGTNLYGTIYKLDPNSKQISAIYNFGGGDGTPSSTLLQAKDNNFYGTTTVDDFPTLDAQIFMVTPSGQATFLYTFEDAFVPGPLIQTADGNFYGVLQSPDFTSAGAVFKMTADHTVTILHSFSYTDGSIPYGTLVQGPNGNLYGVTEEGGTAGNGVIFEISTDGTSYQVIHNFGDGSVLNDGVFPRGTLVVGQDKNLYGTTWAGGSAGWGTVFRISP
jgi:uncharacterized repeat protein (TIGR03803 family)